MLRNHLQRSNLTGCDLKNQDIQFNNTFSPFPECQIERLTLEIKLIMLSRIYLKLLQIMLKVHQSSPRWRKMWVRDRDDDGSHRWSDLDQDMPVVWRGYISLPKLPITTLIVGSEHCHHESHVSGNISCFLHSPVSIGVYYCCTHLGYQLVCPCTSQCRWCHTTPIWETEKYLAWHENIWQLLYLTTGATLAPHWNAPSRSWVRTDRLRYPP